MDHNASIVILEGLAALGALGGLLWYMLKTRDARLNNHSKRIDDNSKDVADNYVRKDDFNRAVDQLRGDIKNLDAKLDRLLQRGSSSR